MLMPGSPGGGAMEAAKKRQIHQQQKAALAPKETRSYKQYGQKPVKLSENEKKARAAITIQRWYRTRRRDRESKWFIVRCLCLVCCCRRYYKPEPSYRGSIEPTRTSQAGGHSPYGSHDNVKKNATLLAMAKKKKKEEKGKEKGKEKGEEKEKEKKKKDETVEKALLLPTPLSSAGSSRAASPEGLRSVAEDISECAKDDVAQGDSSKGERADEASQNEVQ